LTRITSNDIMASRWGPGPESAGATGDAGQARAERRSRRGGGPDQVWQGGVVPAQRRRFFWKGESPGFSDFWPKTSVYQGLDPSDGVGLFRTGPSGAEAAAGGGAVGASALPAPRFLSLLKALPPGNHAVTDEPEIIRSRNGGAAPARARHRRSAQRRS
jgi:hypothetical protein